MTRARSAARSWVVAPWLLVGVALVWTNGCSEDEAAAPSESEDAGIVFHEDGGEEDAMPPRPPCLPASVDGGSVPAYAPMSDHTGACSPTQLQGFDDACGERGADDRCGTFLDDPANASCSECLYGDEEDTTRTGVFVGDSINFAGLVDVAGGSDGCVAAEWTLWRCKDVACASCGDAFDACMVHAPLGPCASEATAASAACASATDDGIVKAQTTFLDTAALRDLAKVGCGTR